MLLLGNRIIKEIKNNKIKYSGDLNNIAINSIDITMSKYLVTYVPLKIKDTKFGKIAVINKKKMKKMKNYIKEIKNIYISMDEENEIFEIEIPKEGLILSPNILFLGSTNEIAGSSNFVPMYEGRSSLARLGFESHKSAGFGDLGFESNWTLEITVVHPLKIFPNKRVGQVFFLNVNEDDLKEAKKFDNIYKGKYTKQIKPQASKSFEDFNK